MEWLCALICVLVFVGTVGHFAWVAVAAIFRAALGHEPPPVGHTLRPYRNCPACGTATNERHPDCSRCHLELDGALARQLHRVNTAEREISGLLDRSELDADTAERVLNQLKARAQALLGRPIETVEQRLRAAPVALADAGERIAAPEQEAVPEVVPEPLAPVLAARETNAPTALPPVPEPDSKLAPQEPPAPPTPPKRKVSGFLEEHNILWGELVGGLLIVGCSIALVVTLRQALEAIPYFRFVLSAAVTLALFGAGQYTLHRWKLTGTSRGMLVISMLLTPLTLLLLAPPFTEGTQGARDAAVKIAALAAFVGVVRTGGRDLIGTGHLPGPVDRRWLLSLAVVGAAGTQLLPAELTSAWVPLVCFVAACGATLGGLSWYHPAQRREPISDKSGTALLMFVGLAAFALVAAWGLFVVRDPAEQLAARLAALAVPLALAGVPVVEAGVLVLRRVASAGLRTMGTAVALAGFATITTGLALAWPDPRALVLVSTATGLFLTRVAFRERLPWVQVGALPLLGFAVVLGFHGIAGNWTAPPALNETLGSPASGAVLTGFALVLALLAEFLARRASKQTLSYATGALCTGALGLFVVNWHGAEFPATAAFVHVAGALGLLASNYRWKARALAHGGLWLVLTGTLWALWWQAPRQPDLWGFAIALEALAFTSVALALRGTHRGATALLRRAGRDVSFAANVLAVAVAASSLTLQSPWHTGTLFTLAATSIALARLTGSAVLTWGGSSVALLGLLHLGVFTWNVKPEALAVEVALLSHATLATLAAILCRRQARVFGDPLYWAARLSTVLAVPLLFFPAERWALACAGFAVWLGALWLAFVLLWREKGAFSGFQAAITLGALLAAFGWIEHQDWWQTTKLALYDPRALHAFGLALGALALVWAAARRALRANARARELWCDDASSLDRLVLGTVVGAFLVLNAVALLPDVCAELTPIGWHTSVIPVFVPVPEYAHAFGPSAWLLLGLLASAVALSWRLSKLTYDTDIHAIGLVLLGLAAPIVWAGGHAVDVASASALRWGMALVFVAGSALVVLRVPVRRVAEALGFVVQPAPQTKLWVLGQFAAAAGVVVILSANVAELGLNRLAPSGPRAESVFAQMGVMASNLVPLALVVFGLATTAGRERSSGCALSGGLVFVATLTAGYALSVVTAGKPLDGTEQVRLLLIVASSAAVWALLWLGCEWRVPGGVPLTLHVLIGGSALAFACLAPAAYSSAKPYDQLPAAFAPLGTFGWGALALVAGASCWHARRLAPNLESLVLASAGAVAGVLVAVGARGWDEPGRWVSFHAMALVWVAVSLGFLAVLNRVRLSIWIVGSFASVLVICALRAGWHDPWRPWFPAGLALATALLFGRIALRTRAEGFAIISGLAVNLAGIFAWVAWGPDSSSGFALANAAGTAIAVSCWTLVRIRLQRAPKGGAWIESLDVATVLALVLLTLGLGPTFGEPRTDPRLLTWGALAVVAVACGIALWDRVAVLSRPGLFGVGALAVLLVIAEADPRTVWDVPATSLALAAYALGIACIAFVLAKRSTPLLGMPARGDSWPWLIGGLALLAVFACALGLRTELTAPDLWGRLASPAGIALFALAFAQLTRVYPEPVRDPLRTLSAALGVLFLAALAWAVPDSNDPFVWLHRNAWLFVALAVAATGGSEGAPSLGADWRRSVRRVAGWTSVAALAILCLNLLQQVPAFNPTERRTPLTRAESLSMLAAIAGLFVLALRFALKADRDPFQLRPARKTVYVYLAEVLIVLFFTQVKFNVPELFRSDLAKLWTFAVMGLAYAGIGLAELFERKKIDVLALPLRRTGVLLPLIPLIAFWAKPPAFVSEFARDTAPGLVPLLGYLDKLPQHFDTYAWLWFLAGGVYGLVALSKKSFGWALLAALATNAAMWALLVHHEVPLFVHPQAWVIPLALIVLVSEHINRYRLSADVSTAMRYAGVSMIYVASAADMFIAGVGASTWLPVVLAVFCVCGVLAGILLRVRAFIYLGVGFLLLDIFSMIWHAAVNLEQTWVWYASGIVLGVVVLALFAYLEKRRGHQPKEPTESE